VKEILAALALSSMAAIFILKPEGLGRNAFLQCPRPLLKLIILARELIELLTGTAPLSMIDHPVQVAGAIFQLAAATGQPSAPTRFLPPTQDIAMR
jgi:hypothetical protein